MRVLHVLYSDIYTGAEKVAAQIIKAFEGDVEMAYASLDSQRVWDILDEQGIRHIAFQKLNPFTLGKIIREYQPDLIHAHDMRTGFVASLCCGKIPLVSHIHNNAFDSRGITLKSVAYLLAGFKARHILWVSNSAFQGYVFHKWFAKKSSVLYNTIDVKRIYEMREQDQNSYDYDVIFVGRLCYEKDPHRLMDVCALMKAKKPDIRVGIVGTDVLEEETRAYCARLGMQDNVDFLGFRNNPMKMVSDSKVMILTSRWEGTPMCVLEAMALGTPVVSTPTDGMKDLIENGVNGYLSDNNEELAEKMLKIVEDAEHRKQLSEGMLRISARINDMDRYRQAISDCYR